MHRNAASRKRSPRPGRGLRWLPAAVERLEVRYAMDGSGITPMVGLQPSTTFRWGGSETSVSGGVALLQTVAPVAIAATAASSDPVNAFSVTAGALEAGAPAPDQQMQAVAGGTVKSRDPMRNLENYPGPYTAGAAHEILQPWPGSLTPNGPGYVTPFFEHEYFHYGEITIDFSDICMADKLAKVNALADAIFADIRDQVPVYFNRRNTTLAESEGPTFIDGDRYYSFKSKGPLAGTLAPALWVNGEFRDGRVYVIMNDLGDRRLQATTLGNHMLVGHLRWTPFFGRADKVEL